jgi:phosphatidylglycerophosphate synthase
LTKSGTGTKEKLAILILILILIIQKINYFGFYACSDRNKPRFVFQVSASHSQHYKLFWIFLFLFLFLLPVSIINYCRKEEKKNFHTN